METLGPIRPVLRSAEPNMARLRGHAMAGWDVLPGAGGRGLRCPPLVSEP